jgi:Fusaric acid resistance protein-like
VAAEPEPAAPGRPAPAPWLAWDWSAAVRGACYAVPAAVVLPIDLRTGVAAAVGVIPAAVVPLSPRRRGRLAIVLLGALMGVAVLLGSVLATTPWLAVVGIFALAVGVTALAARRRQAMILLLLGLPLVGVGLSYVGLAAAVPLALLFVAGSAYACAVAMCWPERPAPPAPTAAEGVPPTLGYGVRLGLAAAICAGIGFALHFDHVGWATAAALLVMRPEAGVLTLRAVGRPVSVGVGAVVAIALLTLRAPDWLIAVVVVLAVVAATATRGSRWYVTPAFTTFMVFLLLLAADPKQAPDRFGERLGETLLGVAVALVFGLLVPLIARRVRPARG